VQSPYSPLGPPSLVARILVGKSGSWSQKTSRAKAHVMCQFSKDQAITVTINWPQVHHPLHFA
jgi:hypothetical protein